MLRALPRLVFTVVVWLLLAAGPAHARHILDLDVHTQPVNLLDWGDAWIDETGQLDLQQVLRRKAEFKPTVTEGQYDVGPGQTLWVAFTVPPTPDDQRWYVRLSMPGVDLVTLYSLGHDDAWTQQKAGDLLPLSQWALPHLNPVLPLAVSPADPTYYVLRIRASDGVRAPIEFLSESRLSAEQQRVSLLYGVYFGLLVMGAVYALTTGVFLRNAGYLWFGLWSLAAMLSAATVVGVAGLHLWPESPTWSDAAQYVLPAATTAPFLVFLASALLLREHAVRLYISLLALAATCSVIAMLAGVLPSPGRHWAVLTAQLIATLAAVGTLSWSWYRGDAFGRNLFAALLPIGLTVPLHFGQLLDVALTGTLRVVIPFSGMAMSLMATYLLLALRSQERRDHRRRIAQLHEFDPTTGLINDVMFARRLQELIDRARKFDHQSVAAVVDFSNLQPLREEFGRKHSLELLLRLAERLSSMMRSMDTVARLGDSRFGLLIDGPVGPSRAKALCAKVIAHCITPLSGLPQGMVVRPKIALLLVPVQGNTVQRVLESLDELLREATNDRTRVILMPPMPTVDSRSFGPSSSRGPNTLNVNPTPTTASGAESTTNFPTTVVGDDFERAAATDASDGAAASPAPAASPPRMPRTPAASKEPEGFDTLMPSVQPSDHAPESLPYGVSLPPSDSRPF